MKNKTNTKKEIFEVAAQLFSEKGYERTTIREIAEKVNVSKPAIYYYFSDKQTLFEDLLNSAIEYSHSILFDIFNSDINPVEKLKEFVIRRVQLCKENPEITRFVGDVISGSIRKDVSINFHDFHAKRKLLFQQVLIQGKKEGYFKQNMDDTAFVFLLIGSLNMLTMSYLRGWSNEITLEQTATSLIDTLIEGIGGEKNEE